MAAVKIQHCRRICRTSTLARYVATRIVLVVPILIAVTSIIFLLLHSAPGNPIDIMLAASKGSREVRELLIQRFGLDKPLYVQYFLWLYNMFTGNLGLSVRGIPVWDVMAPRVSYTLELMLVAQIVSILIATFLGAIAGYKSKSRLDRALTTLALIGYSVPNFWLGLILILIFSVTLGWFPVGAFAMDIELTRVSWISSFPLHAKYLLLPMIVIVVEFAPYYFRILRSSMMDVSGQDYVVTARSKGLKESVVIFKHALRNALVPLTTAVATSLGLIFGGSYVAEIVFAWPGLGSLLVAAALARDYWIVMGVSFVTAVIMVVSSIVLDVAYAFLNPKIRFGSAEN